MNDEKKVTTTRVFIGDAMAVKHLGEAMHGGFPERSWH